VLTTEEQKRKNLKRNKGSNIVYLIVFLFIFLPYVIIFDPRSVDVSFLAKLNTWVVISVPTLLTLLFSPSGLDWFATDGYPRLIELKN
jgi:hypothetical protein